ncbi:hypothetical protein DY000_02044153 [Brassica cretica]|uniref:Ig-like domain-containing protein n=1 Tax=Brassica cretica TaxID=69181 RepID=A0ABQ7F1I1_BRACR|nr:hypothetical protein DY000_02044153 [Brassica cretica]
MCSSSPLLTTDCLVGALRFGVKTRRCCVPGRGGTRRGSCYDKGERSAKVSTSPFSSVDGGSVLVLCSVLFAVSRSVPYARTVWFRRGRGADGKVPWSVELRSSSTVV